MYFQLPMDPIENPMVYIIGSFKIKKQKKKKLPNAVFGTDFPNWFVFKNHPMARAWARIGGKRASFDAQFLGGQEGMDQHHVVQHLVWMGLQKKRMLFSWVK